MTTVRDVLELFPGAALVTCTACGGSRWVPSEAGSGSVCATCGADAGSQVLSEDQRSLLAAAAAADCPWLRLHSWQGMVAQGAVAGDEAGWRLFVTTASPADLDAARYALARGAGLVTRARGRRRE
jgi:hypothetical protein